MKALIAFLALLPAAAASARPIYFLLDSPLPSALRLLIAERIEQGCPNLHSLEEVETSVRIEEPDQQQRDTFYTSHITGSYNWNQHQISVRMWIGTEDNGISNPTVERYTLTSFETDDNSGICE